MLKGRLEGKVALISGGTGGQGTTEVKLFCSEGAKVIFGDINDEKGKALETEVRNSGGDATYVHLDVTSESDWQKAVSKSVEIYGQLDILINNAGVILMKGLEDTTEEEWDFVQNVNSKGVFLGSKSVISAMKKSGGGSIVNISSIAGLTGSPMSAYGASKGAVRLLTKSIAVQYGSDGIRCNSVHPGTLGEGTEMGVEFLSPENSAAVNRILGLTVLGRLGKPIEIAMGVLYLASDESSYVTGSELVIDGGMFAK
jgi:NAD(P)-dependent dehydrogenase (short-subunit alcohol dehydrogenase family)